MVRRPRKRGLLFVFDHWIGPWRVSSFWTTGGAFIRNQWTRAYIGVDGVERMHYGPIKWEER